MLPETVTVKHVQEWLESLPPKTVVQEYDGVNTLPSTCCVTTTYAKEFDGRAFHSNDLHVTDINHRAIAKIEPALGAIMYNGFDAVGDNVKLEAHEALSIIDRFTNA